MTRIIAHAQTPRLDTADPKRKTRPDQISRAVPTAAEASPSSYETADRSTSAPDVKSNHCGVPARVCQVLDPAKNNNRGAGLLEETDKIMRSATSANLPSGLVSGTMPATRTARTYMEVRPRGSVVERGVADGGR